jgi:hypothetical protein
MPIVRRLVVAAALCLAVTAFAKAPPGQGRACDAKSRCDAGLTCVAQPGGKSSCQLTCSPATKCPEDQRCVKDGAQSVCRPINDAVGL